MLCLCLTESHILDDKTRIAYCNGSVSPHLDYGDIVWGDQPGLKSEMDRLQAFQKRVAKKILGKKISSSETLNSLQLIPLVGRRFAHRCSAVQNAFSIGNRMICSDIWHKYH